MTSASNPHASANSLHGAGLGLRRALLDSLLQNPPGSFDFLSPALTEAAIMTRVLDSKTFTQWFKKFVPDLYRGKWQLKAAEATDRTDPKLVHLDGLNFSRAWCLHQIAHQLNKKSSAFNILANNHINASLQHLESGNYGGEHWLVSFAILAMQ